MGAYESFALVYDEFMEEVPYEKWADWLTGYLQKNGISDGIVLDLGCGTGKMTRLLSAAGYDMIGADSSAAMLQEAREAGGDDGILYLQQDMRELDLYGTVRAAVSVCDCMNYLLEREELLQVFRLVNNFLDPGGLFLFDMNTLYKYSQVLGDSTFAEAGERDAYIWENTWDEEAKVNIYDLTIFRQEGREGLFRRYEETHYQKGYDIPEIMELLETAGMKAEAVFDAYTCNPPAKDSERVCFAAREVQKNPQGGVLPEG